MAGVPNSVYYAEGFGGNFIMIDNDHDIVVAVRWLDSDKIGELMDLIIKSIENSK
jgi:predicted transcriptional regulator